MANAIIDDPPHRSHASRTVIAIHGVGDAQRRELARTLAGTLGFRSATLTDVVAERTLLTEARDAGSGDRVIEVNWSDILKPKSSLSGLLRHHVYLVTSMVDVAAKGDPDDARWVVRLYRWLLFTVTPGSIYLSIATAVAHAIPDAGTRRLVLIATLLAWCALSWWFLRLGKLYHWLWPWAVAAFALMLASWAHPLALEHPIVRIAEAARKLSLYGGIVSLVLAAASSLRARGRGWDQRLARLALLYVPYIAMNSVTTWIGLLGLGLLRREYKAGYCAWEAHVLPEPMARALAGVELWTTIAFTALGLAALALPLLGYRRKWTRGKHKTAEGEPLNEQGLGAQNGIAYLLRMAPVLLVALLVACIHAYATRLHPPLKIIDRLAAGGIIEIYALSVWRTIPYAVWLRGPFGLALDVVGDVLFYVQPDPNHPAAIGALCRGRLAAALRYARATGGDNLVVLAHSQGTVIATDVLRELPQEEGADWGGLGFVTLGSPLDALYARFLGEEKTMTEISSIRQWRNGYRNGDVIAGPIAERKGVASNVFLGTGGHVNYWELVRYLPGLIAEVALEAGRPPPPRLLGAGADGGSARERVAPPTSPGAP
jgi:hypothetical protein